MKKANREITDYDGNDTTAFIDKQRPLRLEDLGFKLPKEGPTKVVSIRIPTSLYNRLKAYSTDADMPYQAYIKYLLSQGVERDLKKERRTSKAVNSSK
jgi:predicted DNA binding CopG/RHH family protein